MDARVKHGNGGVRTKKRLLAVPARSSSLRVQRSNGRGRLLLRKPATRSLPAAASMDEPENDQKQNGADGSGNNGGNNSAAQVNSQLRKQPTPDQGANNADA